MLDSGHQTRVASTKGTSQMCRTAVTATVMIVMAALALAVGVLDLLAYTEVI